MVSFRLRHINLFVMGISMLFFSQVSVNAMNIPPNMEPTLQLSSKNKQTKGMPLVPYKSRTRRIPFAMAIPGNGVAEQVFVGGFANFLQIYNLVITARILLSWFPQAQSIGALQPVFGITDPYLNLFRGLIPPIGGLDLSPILAFFALNAATTATAALGAEVPKSLKQFENKLKKQSSVLLK